MDGRDDLEPDVVPIPEEQVSVRRFPHLERANLGYGPDDAFDNRPLEALLVLGGVPSHGDQDSHGAPPGHALPRPCPTVNLAKTDQIRHVLSTY